MARTRLADPLLQSWDEVDRCLAEIGHLDRQLTDLEVVQQHDIDAIKARTKAAAEPLLAKKTGLEMAIKAYCEAHRADFIKTKTRQLTFGTVGFRLSSAIVIRRVADTLAALKAAGLDACIRREEKPDKDAMRNLTDEQLAMVGAARKTEDAFGYDINRDRLPQKAA